MVKSCKDKALHEQGLLPEIQKAVIATNGKLTPNFEYISTLREENLKKSLTTRKKEQLSIEFDKSKSVFQNNTTVIENIQGETLDFAK